jgi:hypothetical protein
MRKVSRLLKLSLLLGLAANISAYADSCADLYKLDEVKFTQTATANPLGTYNTLNLCIANQSCANSDNPNLCMQNLYYYDSMAAFYLHQAQTGAQHSTVSASISTLTSTPASTPSLNTAPTPAAATPVLNPIIAPPSNANTNTNANDIYQNIRF